MNVWMVVGYGDYESSYADNVFVNKDDAINSLISTAFQAWSMKSYDRETCRYVGEPYIYIEGHKIGYDEFVNKVRDYITSKNLNNLSLWAGSTRMAEIFPYWNDRNFYVDSWFSLKEVPLKK